LKQNWKNKIMKITPREKKFIVVGAAAVAAVSIFYLITSLLPNRESLAQEVALKKRMLLRERETLSNEETYRNRVEQYRKHLEEDKARLFPGDNPNVAGANLQKLLMDLADQCGVEITRKNALPEKKIQDVLTKVSVSIETNCDLEQLVHFLTAIENYDKFMNIEEFQIASFQNPRSHQIRPTLTVVGYISSQGSEPNEKSRNAGAAASRPAAAVAEQPGK
jgi:type II secretory pathway component PulM